MMSRRILLVVVTICLAACGGSNDNNTKTEDEVVADFLDIKKDGEGFFLREFPDPCGLLSEEKARGVLGGDVKLWPPRGISCTYAGTVDENAGKGVSVTMQFLADTMIDSKAMSSEELEERIQSLFWQGAALYTASSDLGVASFVFGNDKRTALVVLTGIGGTAVISDRIVSEAVLSYSLMNPGQAHEARLGQLEELATDQLSQLTELARTTHGGPK